MCEVLDNPLHVPFGAGRVEDAQPDCVSPGQPGSGHERVPAAFQGVGERNPAALSLGLVAAWPFPAEAHDPQRRRRHQSQPGIVPDQLFGVGGQLHVAVNGRAERGYAEGLHRHPDLQRVEAPGQLQPPIAEVDFAGLVGFAAVEIVGVDSERAGETVAVADQDSAALERLKQPLMWVEGHRVSPLDASQHRAPFGVSAAKPP